jgi:hypothetical protein
MTVVEGVTRKEHRWLGQGFLLPLGIQQEGITTLGTYGLVGGVPMSGSPVDTLQDGGPSP